MLALCVKVNGQTFQKKAAELLVIASQIKACESQASITLNEIEIGNLPSLLRSHFLGCHATLPPKKWLLTSEQHSFSFVFVVCLHSVEQTNHIIAIKVQMT